MRSDLLVCLKWYSICLHKLVQNDKVISIQGFNCQKSKTVKQKYIILQYFMELFQTPGTQIS